MPDITPTLPYTLTPLVGADIPRLLASIGRHDTWLAIKLRCSRRLIGKWAKGELPVPPSIMTWLARYADAAIALEHDNPAPDPVTWIRPFAPIRRQVRAAPSAEPATPVPA